MKKMLIITSLALAAAGMNLNSALAAPDGSSGGHGHHGGASYMMKDLNLTDAQKTQLRDIMEQQRLDAHAKIRAILTTEQQATFDASLERMEQRRNGIIRK